MKKGFNMKKILIFGIFLFLTLILNDGLVSAADLTLNSLSDIQEKCSYDSTTRTYNCTADNITITSSITLDRYEVVNGDYGSYGKCAEYPSKNIIFNANNKFKMSDGVIFGMAGGDAVGCGYGCNCTSHTVDGGYGGDLTINATSVEIYRIEKQGGNARGHISYGSPECSQNGGDGGKITIKSNSVVISDKIISSGSSGAFSYSRCGSDATGGRGGDVFIEASSITGGSIELSGGGYQDPSVYGGSGGSLTIKGKDITLTTIRLTGSDGARSYCDIFPPVSGGIGGNLDINATGSVEINNIELKGGDTASAGTVKIKANSFNLTGSISMKGGSGNDWANCEYNGCVHGEESGGSGGTIEINANSFVNINSISMRGGDGYGSGWQSCWECSDSAGSGGYAGDVTVNANSITISSINLQGGNGGTNSYGGSGGNGGSVKLGAENSIILKGQVNLKGGSKGSGGCPSGSDGKNGVFQASAVEKVETKSIVDDSTSIIGYNVIIGGSIGGYMATVKYCQGSGFANVNPTNKDVSQLPDSFCKTLAPTPIQSLLELHGRVRNKDKTSLSQGSIRVEIKKAGKIVYTKTFNDIIKRGYFKLRLGETDNLMLIPLETYELEITVSNQTTYACSEPAKCETFKVGFIP